MSQKSALPRSTAAGSSFTNSARFVGLGMGTVFSDGGAFGLTARLELERQIVSNAMNERPGRRMCTPRTWIEIRLLAGACVEE
jgi:hypothetical protein